MSKRKIVDPRQRSIFDFGVEEPEQPNPASDAPPITAFDPAKLRITEHHGNPYILDIDLARALGYAEPRMIRRLIKRLLSHKGWGTALHRVTLFHAGNGAQGEVIEYLLTEKQVCLICMRSELPDIEDVQSQIADVFIEWQHGRLRPIDAKTETKLLDASDRAYISSPEVVGLLAKLVANDNDRKQDLADIKLYIQQQTDAGRKDFSKQQCDLYARTLDRFYGGLDPGGGQVKLTDGMGHLLPHPAVEVDHYNGLRGDNRTVNGWPLSPNTHKRKTAGEGFGEEFNVFLKRLRAVLESEAETQQELKFTAETNKADDGESAE